MQAWLETEPFELIVCESLLNEVETLLIERDHLKRSIGVEEARLYVERLRTAAEVCKVPPTGVPLTRDPDGDFVIYLARQHDADVIVSGDRDLLEWPGQTPPVVTPGRFVEMLDVS